MNFSKPNKCAKCGADAVAEKTEKYCQVRCVGCGRAVKYQRSTLEAITNWNAQQECIRKMRGHEND